MSHQKKCLPHAAGRHGAQAFVLALCLVIGALPGQATDVASDALGPMSVARLVRESGVAGGLIVHVGCGDGAETAVLAAKENFSVQGLEQVPLLVEQALQAAYPPQRDGRLTYRYWAGGALPYVDSLVNLLVWQLSAGAPDRDEVLRVLVPGGVAFIETEVGWMRWTRGWPEAMDSWPQFRYDAGATGMSRDSQVGPPAQVQWEAGPRFMRSHEIETGLSSLVSDNGRIYYILDEGPIGIIDARFPAKWALLCRDAFNGMLLWKRSLPNWGWQKWSDRERVNDPNTWLGLRTRAPDVERLMATKGDTLWVTLGFGAPVTAINGRTGETLREWPESRGTQELLYHRGAVIVRRDAAQPIMALCAEEGGVLWQAGEAPCLGRSLVAVGNRVFYHNRDHLIALDLETGEEQWRQETNIRPNVVMASPEVVLAVQSAVMWAYDPDTGAFLWEGPGTHRRGNYPDLFLGDGLVWAGMPEFNARHARTGAIARTLSLQKVLESGHHWRCYANKASECFMLTGVRGVEFVDLGEGDHSRHNWFRGPCMSGLLPANGLLYVPSHQCFCYPAVRMDGFFALAPANAAPLGPAPDVSAATRLKQGPAWGDMPEGSPAAPDAWPMYRQNARRGGQVAASIPDELVERWAVALGGHLTQAVAADGRVVVAQKEAGTVHCLDVNTGEALWRVSVGGAIDSAPALHNGCVYFGGRDGWVHALRASDGAHIWRFRAAPEDRHILSHGRVESVWPVHGGVLIFNDLLYTVAGRSGFLDGGIRLYALEPGTGAVVHQNVLEGPRPDISVPSEAFHKDGYRADMLSTDGRYLYMGRTALDSALNEIETERVKMVGTQRGDNLEYRIMPGMRLVATAGFLDDTFWNRSWWMHTYVWPGFHYAQQAPKSGQLLVFDDHITYTVKHYHTRNRHSPMLFPGSRYLLFADDNDNEPLFYRGEGEPTPMEWEPELPAETRWTIYLDAAVDKGPGFTRARPTRWTTWVDVRVEAMALVGDRLVLAGVPDIVPENDPLAALEGQRGGLMQVLAPEDGRVCAEYVLPARPVFDGLSAARDRLFVATADGYLRCMGGGS